ncbi:hypothetical protein [Blastococcus montanus]|uniref:hypothetical protein n=1 Tax=Blastococcus montanus TaxID=3144973 RepID=UPI00320B3EB7
MTNNPGSPATIVARAQNPPLIMSVQTARLLASVADVVPTLLLDAAGAVLEAVSDQVWAEVLAHPGRRGNGALRARANADLALCGGLRDELGWRLPGHPCRVDEVTDMEELPPLGPQQWAVVAANRRSWAGTVGELFMVAQATVLDEPPIDVAPWARWCRRRRWAGVLGEVRRDLQFEVWAEDSRMREAAAALDQAEKKRQSAAAAREAAENLTATCRMYEMVAALDDEALAVFEEAVDSGPSLEEALRLARGIE